MLSKLDVEKVFQVLEFGIKHVPWFLNTLDVFVSWKGFC
jgi:hypothetical protein